jgi:hypothetical protein
MTSERNGYPVPGRSAQRNRQFAAHEAAGHAMVTRALGDTVWSVTIIPDRGPNGFEGRCVRSGPPSDLTLDENVDETAEILTICERLERLSPEIGSGRVKSAEYISHCQNNAIELLAGEVAESILCPDHPPLGAIHDHVEAAAFARVAVASQPATLALIEYCRAEARAIIESNRDVAEALVAAVIEAGELSGKRVDEIISGCIATRSIEKERQRRIEWKVREHNAATFKTS